MVLETTKGSVNCPKVPWFFSELWSTNALCKFYILLYCLTLHMEISERSPTKLCQMVGG